MATALKALALCTVLVLDVAVGEHCKRKQEADWSGFDNAVGERGRASKHPMGDRESAPGSTLPPAKCWDSSLQLKTIMDLSGPIRSFFGSVWVLDPPLVGLRTQP